MAIDKELKRELKIKQQNEQYIRRYVRNMIARENGAVIKVAEGIIATMPDLELCEGLGFEWERR